MSTVRVFVFNSQGQLVGPVDSPPVKRTDAEWRARLAPEQYRILRHAGTERPFCGNLLDNKREGVYSCAGCGLPLFASKAKFNSGTGWPSFFQPIAHGNVVERSDTSHGMLRTEILCARCEGHLGHVFDDGPRPSGLRYCLNSESLNFTEVGQLASLADPAADQAAHGVSAPAAKEVSQGKAGAASGAKATAVLAGGCFWCTEAAFEQLDGVSDVTSGYTGGDARTANYKAVCGGDTGHAEAIRITYDPQVISFETLLEVFFDAHDPTQRNRQGNDIGSQYRSAIFYANDEQQQAAQAKIAQLTAMQKFPRPIVTTLEPLGPFYEAETYHQDYARNNPDQPYVAGHSIPLACKVRSLHPRLMRPGSEWRVER